MTVFFWLLTAIILYTSLAPLSQSARWWIRAWDFPRVHIAILAIFSAALGFVLGGLVERLASIVLLGCALYQAVRVFPYTRFAKTQIPFVDVPKSDQVSAVSANVLMENDGYDLLIELITRESPDILFLMETNERWVEALVPVLETYETVVRHPLENHYGLVFATRLKAHKADTHFLSDDDTPAIVADLEGPNGRFYFVGLHPRPPTPGHDTEERDAQIKRSARIADRVERPVVVMGDFNDVAWSRSSERFKEYGEFRDPRLGRGMISSFDARSSWIRLPIDQAYVTEGIDLVSFDRLTPVGSDHFPMKAVFSVSKS